MTKTATEKMNANSVNQLIYIKLFIPFCTIASYCLVCTARPLHKPYGLEKADIILTAYTQNRSKIEARRKIHIWYVLPNRYRVGNNLANYLFPVHLYRSDRLQKNLSCLKVWCVRRC